MIKTRMSRKASGVAYSATDKSAYAAVDGQRKKMRGECEASPLDVRAFARVTLDIGQYGEQGDIYYTRIQAIPPGAAPRQSMQLAEGDTQGSRHVLTAGKTFSVTPEAARSAHKILAGLRDYQVGPVIDVPAGAVISHPEHGDRELTEAGCYLISFQRSLLADGSEERARD